MFKLHPQLQQDCHIIGDFPLCRALLMNEKQFPWLILVPRINDIQEVYQLPLEKQQQLQIESNTLSKLLMAHFNGDKLNTAALGNMVPQLHIHHIVRFTADAVWPKPVWGNFSSSHYTSTELNALQKTLKSLLLESGLPFTPSQSPK